MNEFTLVSESLQQARRDLGLEDDLMLGSAENPFERLLDFLEIQIRNLLDRDFAGLLNALYRIDIPEKTVMEILENAAPDHISRKLAEVVLEREKQKVITRQRYR